MQENRADVSSSSRSHAFALNAVTRSLMFMLVFCFAGCAAGSCLSYGHSCWGAHGKRSGYNYPAGNRPENDERPALAGGPGNEAAGQSLQDRWVLSRLVTRQLSAPAGPQEFQENWYNSNKGRGHARSWGSNDVGPSSAVEIAKPLRRDEVEVENDDDDDEEEEDEEEIRDEVVVPRVMSREVREQVLESRDISDDDELVLLPPSNSHFKPIGQSHKLRLFKILNGAAGKLK
ncbi:uncharacterized protein LOC124416481 [Diprion similis]|uniref:uncharacterized protein LOC124416481 n=1 Tax=Diprion similis TaxID=362088 RepID=UPI001EF8C702|nr:uncharacterized protein LOC124416481 [Diprion similis]